MLWAGLSTGINFSETGLNSKMWFNHLVYNLVWSNPQSYMHIVWIFVPWLLLFNSADPFPLLCTTCQCRNSFRAQSEGNYRDMGTSTRFCVHSWLQAVVCSFVICLTSHKSAVPPKGAAYSQSFHLLPLLHHFVSVLGFTELPGEQGWETGLL